MATSATHTRTSKTERDYVKRYRQIRRQAAASLGIQNEAFVGQIQIVRHLIARKPGLAKRTWQLYKSAVRFVIERLPQTPETIEALELLASQSQSGALPRGSETSAKKAKNFSAKDYQRLSSYLESNYHRHPLAKPLHLWCELTLIAGLRPGEWPTLEAHEDDAGVLEKLVIGNSKVSNGRGNGSTRTILTDRFTEHELRIVQEVFTIFPSLYAEQGRDRLQNRLRKYMARAVRACLGKRDKYPSLYTLRHQFAANAKANLSQAEVAALMGHASDATAGRNYAKARQATGTVNAKAAKEEIARVRPRARSFAPSPQMRRI